MTHDVLSDLTAELDLQVSPEFAAKVRTRIREEREHAAGQRGWVLASVLSGMAACAIVGVTLGPWSTPSVSLQTAAGKQERGEAGKRVLPAAKAEDPSDVRSTRVAARPRSDSSEVAPMTEEARALNWLLLSIRSGRASVPGEARAPIDRDGLLIDPEPIRLSIIRITPIEIEPLPAIEPLWPWEDQR